MTGELVAETEGAGDQPHPPAWLRPLREWVLRRPAGMTIWRSGVAIIGAAIVAGGLLLIPLPGPGWAIVFLGLAVWATEFVWAQRLLRFGRGVLRAWTDWVMRQSLLVRGLIAVAGLAFLAGLLYLGWRVFLTG